jgi:hypothetical protein
MKTFLALTTLVLASATPLYADTVATWTFESSSSSIAGTSNHIDGIAAEVGSGIASGVHASASTVWSSPAGNGSAHSFSANNWSVGDYWQLQVNTTGYHGLSLSFDQTGSGTGPRDFTLSYSLNGSSFTQIGSYSVLANASPNPLWNSTTSSSLYTYNYDLGSLVDDSPTVYFQIMDADTTSTTGGTVGTGGTDRIDNFSVFTTPVPEPSTVAIGILSGLAGLFIWKRRG